MVDDFRQLIEAQRHARASRSTSDEASTGAPFDSRSKGKSPKAIVEEQAKAGAVGPHRAEGLA